MDMIYLRQINDNSKFTYQNEINLDGGMQFYKQQYTIDFYDDCSNLSFIYSKNDYDDGNQLNPSTTFAIEYNLDFSSGSGIVNSLFE